MPGRSNDADTRMFIDFFVKRPIRKSIEHATSRESSLDRRKEREKKEADPLEANTHSRPVELADIGPTETDLNVDPLSPRISYSAHEFCMKITSVCIRK